MKRVLITGANSFVGVNVEKWLLQTPDEFIVETVDTMNEAWKKADFAKYDVVFHVAGIAHVDPKPKMAPLYYKVNRDLTHLYEFKDCISCEQEPERGCDNRKHKTTP